MKNALHKTVDVICVLMKIAIAIISLPIEIVKGIKDIISIIRNPQI